MKIVLLSAASSIHTIRWANGLAEAGHTVDLITQHPPAEPFIDSVTVHQARFRGNLGYFLMAPYVRKILNYLQPDILNAHYASGYGTTARLVNYRPYMLSVWGSDIYDFPRKSPLHKYIVQKNLAAADRVASTSHCMAEETLRLVPTLSNIAITPFGVDTKRFEVSSFEKAASLTTITIGTVKSLSSKYGISTLLRAFAILRARLLSSSPRSGRRLQLRLVGDGPQMQKLQALACDLDIADCTTFVGRVPHSQVPIELSKLDIYVALSEIDCESFGVAIIEAGAAARPVVVSNAGGLSEVTVNNVTGIVVPAGNPEAAAAALERLVLDPDLRFRMGQAARRYVKTCYDWPLSIDEMVRVYASVVASKS